MGRPQCEQGTQQRGIHPPETPALPPATFPRPHPTTPTRVEASTSICECDEMCVRGGREKGWERRGQAGHGLIFPPRSLRGPLPPVPPLNSRLSSSE